MIQSSLELTQLSKLRRYLAHSNLDAGKLTGGQGKRNFSYLVLLPNLEMYLLHAVSVVCRNNYSASLCPGLHTTAKT